MYVTVIYILYFPTLRIVQDTEAHTLLLCREHCVNVIYLFVQPGDAGKKCFGGILFGSGSDFQS